MTAEHKQYEATYEFKSYLEARGAWEAFKATYVGPCDQWYTMERELYGVMCATLKICRALPIHVLAFGW